ncbi:MAG: tetratricopeptide repeat protein, partial [Candidatus Sumerlaeia bacterium]|nr:tetratricopeptide repeat protein [Candidatus Sumerlaeia bacterium]
MICPYCRTINRDDQDICYHCNRDLSMLRLIVNKAKHHYNIALEHAERGRYVQAITELQNALDLDRHNIDALVVLGTVYARMGQLD